MRRTDLVKRFGAGVAIFLIISSGVYLAGHNWTEIVAFAFKIASLAP